MPLSKESKDVLKSKILVINESIAIWQSKLEPLLDKKKTLQTNIDHLQSLIDGLKSDRTKIQNDVKDG